MNLYLDYIPNDRNFECEKFSITLSQTKHAATSKKQNCAVGYNDFDIFDKMEPPRQEIDVKLDTF